MEKTITFNRDMFLSNFSLLPQCELNFQYNGIRKIISPLYMWICHIHCIRDAEKGHKIAFLQSMVLRAFNIRKNIASQICSIWRKNPLIRVWSTEMLFLQGKTKNWKCICLLEKVSLIKGREEQCLTHLKKTSDKKVLWRLLFSQG